MPDNTTTLPRRPQLPVPEIAAAIEALIELLNRAAGDPDLEDNGDGENDGTDQGDPAWIEWGRMAPSSKRGPNASGGDEDAEDDDPAEDDGVDSCAAGDDRGTGDGGLDDGQPGDAGDSEDSHDAEHETWSHWMDHPVELHGGQRPGHTTDQDVR